MTTSKISLALQTALILILAAPSRGQSPSGSISGTLTGENGTIPAATIRAMKLGSPHSTSPVTVNASGAFKVTGLADGLYEVCVAVKNGGYLDPCLWSPPAPVTVTGGAAVTGNDIVLVQAAKVTIQLNDPGQLLSSAIAPSPASKVVRPQVMVGVFTPRGIFLPAPVVAKSATGRTHSVPIPHDTTARIQLVGRGVTVTNQAGQPVNIQTGTTIPVIQALAGPQTQFTFTVGK